jgi:hypothetical protein
MNLELLSKMFAPRKGNKDSNIPIEANILTWLGNEVFVSVYDKLSSITEHGRLVSSGETVVDFTRNGECLSTVKLPSYVGGSNFPPVNMRVELGRFVGVREARDKLVIDQYGAVGLMQIIKKLL